MNKLLTDLEIRKTKIENQIFGLLILTAVYISIAAVALGAVLFAVASLLATAGSDGAGWVVLLVGVALFAAFATISRGNFKKKDELQATI